jgi:hypothetical protein
MTVENKILGKYLAIAVLLIGVAYLTGVEIINGLVSIFDLYLIIALIITGLKKDKLNKNYYYFLIAYLVILGVLPTGQLGALAGTALLIVPHIWFVVKRKNIVSPQVARSYYFIISPLLTLFLFYALSFTEIFNIYALSPITWIARLI